MKSSTRRWVFLYVSIFVAGFLGNLATFFVMKWYGLEIQSVYGWISLTLAGGLAGMLGGWVYATRTNMLNELVRERLRNEATDLFG